MALSSENMDHEERKRGRQKEKKWRMNAERVAKFMVKQGMQTKANGKVSIACEKCLHRKIYIREWAMPNTMLGCGAVRGTEISPPFPTSLWWHSQLKLFCILDICRWVEWFIRMNNRKKVKKLIRFQLSIYLVHQNAIIMLNGIRERWWDRGSSGGGGSHNHICWFAIFMKTMQTKHLNVFPSLALCVCVWCDGRSLFHVNFVATNQKDGGKYSKRNWILMVYCHSIK